MDISRFKWSESDRKSWQSLSSTATKRATKPKPKRSFPKLLPGRFVKGPIPLAWLSLAATCGRKGLHVALAVWYRVGITGSSQVKLSAGTLERFSVDSRTANRILAQFEAAGLVTVERKPGRAPLVTVLATDDGCPTGC